jgi:hypothetical protein
MDDETQPASDPTPPPSAPNTLDSAGVRSGQREARKARARRRVARREACFELLSAGYAHQEIAARLKVSLASVRRDVALAIEQRRLDAPERYVHFQVDRLTRALRSMDDLVERGDVRAVKPLINLVGALDRYHGLDARYRREPLLEPSLLSGPERAPPPLALSAPADTFANVADLGGGRHCEEPRSRDVAIQGAGAPRGPWIASHSLAMTQTSPSLEAANVAESDTQVLEKPRS